MKGKKFDNGFLRAEALGLVWTDHGWDYPQESGTQVSRGEDVRYRQLTPEELKDWYKAAKQGRR